MSIFVIIFDSWEDEKSDKCCIYYTLPFYGTLIGGATPCAAKI